MKTVEFETVIDNGVIRIPDDVKEQIGKQVKVILFSNETVKPENKTKTFSAISINTRGFTFNRDEANAR